MNHSLVGEITGPKPEFISPRFDCDAFHIPIIELDINYEHSKKEEDKSPTDKNLQSDTKLSSLIDGLRMYWTTEKNPRFSEKRMVTVDFSVLPPKNFPKDHAPNIKDSQARYLLFFRMNLHPEWGDGGNKITRLKIVPAGAGAEGTKVMLNFVCTTYDVSLHTTNATLINATHKFYMFNDNDEFLAHQMPRLR
ncbi:MAG: hypothetical protein SNJ70_05710 [Armatimonadota bacterium]